MIYQRRGVYHCDFTLNGQRYRQTLETRDWREAKQKEHDLIALAKEGKVSSGRTAEFARLPFEAAADRYLADLVVQRPESLLRRGNRRKSWEGDLLERLRPFFQAKRLNQILPDDIRAYQAHRLGQGKHPNTVNHEVKALLRLLKRAKLASRLRDDVKLLRVVKRPRQVLTPAEKQRLLETASSRPQWQTAYCAALLTSNTSARPVELRRLCWHDLDPENRLIIIRRSKTEAGRRVIPLNDEAWSAIVALKERADDLGTYAPEHFIFHRQWPKDDPTRPMWAWRSAWRSLRAEAAKGNKEKGREEMPRLARIRFYDLRHQCITEMLEAGIPEGVIREVAGHVDPAMTRHYSHPRLAARRAAVEALSAIRVAMGSEVRLGGYVTKHVTKQLPAAPQSS